MGTSRLNPKTYLNEGAGFEAAISGREFWSVAWHSDISHEQVREDAMTASAHVLGLISNATGADDGTEKDTTALDLISKEESAIIWSCNIFTPYNRRYFWSKSLVEAPRFSVYKIRMSSPPIICHNCLQSECEETRMKACRGCSCIHYCVADYLDSVNASQYLRSIFRMMTAWIKIGTITR